MQFVPNANGNVEVMVFSNTVKKQTDINLIRAYELKRRKQHDEHR